MPQYSNSQLKKGSIGAPYTHNEYLQLFREKKMEGRIRTSIQQPDRLCL